MHSPSSIHMISFILPLLLYIHYEYIYFLPAIMDGYILIQMYIIQNKITNSLPLFSAYKKT